MSEKKVTIEVRPDGRIRKEAFMIPPMVCPYCGGKGWFYSGERTRNNYISRLRWNRRGHRLGDDRLETE